MPPSDSEILDLFHRRFGAIEAVVGSPPSVAQGRFRRRRRSATWFAGPILGLAAVAVAVIAVGLLGLRWVRESGAPSGSRASAATPWPPFIYEAMPPPEIVDWLATRTDIGFRPLTEAELKSISVTKAQAEASALRQPGFGYGPGNSTIVWAKVGCAYLGVFRAPHQPRLGYDPPTYPAYLVQLIGSPVDEFPNLNIGLEVVDARTGVVGSSYSFGDGPILGTTCDVTP